MGMGCSVSAQLTVQDGKADCDNNQNEESPKRLTKPDPRCPLSERQIFALSKSWKGISRNMKDAGMLMFLRLFETNKELKKLFGDQFNKLDTASEMIESKTLENHAFMVMCTIDDAICNIDDIDYVLTQLASVGRFHTKIKSYDGRNFEKIEDPFLMAVKEVLGDRYSINIDLVYKKTIHFITETLSTSFDREAARIKAEALENDNINENDIDKDVDTVALIETSDSQIIDSNKANNIDDITTKIEDVA
ncbi:unnamed protein product [Owenia fusiformis]|uniref:Globin domain-containing protein n=1 Tax=Owenia fusiformis TaxID=6347 RepID=A0A8J1U4D8_OWEFU|nr:unnamed protein product [Owenia fusiformis]